MEIEGEEGRRGLKGTEPCLFGTPSRVSYTGRGGQPSARRGTYPEPRGEERERGFIVNGSWMENFFSGKRENRVSSRCPGTDFFSLSGSTVITILFSFFTCSIVSMFV